MKLWPSKEEEKEDDSVALPVQARGGNYFRTSAFHNTANPEWITWREAHEHPLNKSWSIREITKRPNTVTPGSDHSIEDIKTVKREQDITFFSAVAALATFESGERKMSEVVPEEAPENDRVYFKTFAENEGTIVFDEYGKPHPTKDGRIVTDGIFPEGAIRKSMESFQEGPPPVDSSLTDQRLLRQFNEAAFDDMAGLLDKHSARLEWKKFVSILDELLEELKDVQRGWEREDDDYSLAGNHYATVREEAENAFDVLQYANGAGSDQKIINDEQSKEIRRFFREVDLAFQIAGAKYLYLPFAEADLKEEASSERIAAFRQYTREAESICRGNLEGSDWDVQRMHAEIINNKVAETIDDESGKSYVYYFPKALLAFIDSCKDVIRTHEEGIAHSRSRVAVRQQPKDVTVVPDDNAPDAAKMRL